ncbi:MAG: hypothetical protein COA57_01515 [Flavobacteriales bacterium]|nr:MAG: hypothetical protein COA57_01515 [Flavobacteriales bacterium]
MASNKIKNSFFSKFQDLSIFDAGLFNLLLPAQIGYAKSYEFDYSFSKKPPWEFIPFAHYKRIISKLKCLSKKPDFDLSQLANRPYFFYMPHKFLCSNGKYIPIYHHKFIEQFGRENSILCLMFYPNEIDIDYDFKRPEMCWDEAQAQPFDKDDTDLLRGITKVIKKIRTHPKVTEREYRFMHVAMQMFWLDFRYWKYIIGKLNPKVGFVLGTYRHEDIIAAFKYWKIPIVETQHVIKLPSDFYIAYPESVKSIRHKALFLDKVFVFGQYWKDQILKGHEYTDDQIENLGFYLHNKDEGVDIAEGLGINKNQNKIVCIVSQPPARDELHKYIDWLADDITSKKLAAQIIIKLHPSDSVNCYDSLKKKHNCIHVVGYHSSILDVFAASDVCVGIYSLSLYEATMYNLPIYILNVEKYKHYIDDIIDSGVATLMKGFENPLLTDDLKTDYDSSYYYQEYNPTIIKELCEKIVMGREQQETVHH